MEHEQRANDHGQAAKPVLALTAAAVEMMRRALTQMDAPASGIRLPVAGGGCKGFQYSLTLTETARPEDVVIRQDGVTAFLDPVRARHLRGTRLDYVSNHHGTGRQFFGLDAGRSIGCGSALLLRRGMAGNARTTGCSKSSKRPLLNIDREVVGVDKHSRTSVAHPGLCVRSPSVRSAAMSAVAVGKLSQSLCPRIAYATWRMRCGAKLLETLAVTN